MKRLHYSWAICFAGALLVFCNLGLCSNIIAVYLPFIEDTGISDSMGSAIVTIRCLFSFLSTFLVTKYYEKISLRIGATVATMAGAVAFVVFSIGGHVVVYYIGAAFCGCAYGLGAIIPMSVLMNNWFNEKRVTAIGIANAGSGIATIIFPPVLTAIITSHGLKSAFLFQVCCMVICAAVVFLIVRDVPELKNMTAYGDPNKKQNISILNTDDFEVPKRCTYILAAMMLLLGGAAMTHTAHVSVLAKSAGYTAEAAAMVVSLFGLAVFLRKIMFGVVADKLGARKASILFICIFILGCLVSLPMDGVNLLWCVLFGLIIGCGAAVFNMGPPLWAAAFAPKKEYSQMLKHLMVYYNLGGIVFTIIPGVIADHTHEYKSSFVLFAVMVMIALGILLYMYEARKHLYKK